MVESVYILELFPTEGNWDKYVEWLGGTTVDRNDDNAGVDLFCVKDQRVSSETATLLDLGVKARMWKSYTDYDGEIHITPCHFWLAPRSSIWKSGVRQANSIGVIDKSYRGILMGAVITNGVGVVEVKEDTRLFQVLAPDMGWISQVVLKKEEELDTTSRGDGGFGSTGN